MGSPPKGFSKQTVEVMWERDQGRCARCGRPLRFDARAFDWSAHHRWPRGMGGSKLPFINLASNGALLCGSGTTGCHGYFEKNRTEAEDNGFIVRSGIRLPVDIAIEHFIYGRVWLTDRGTVSRFPPQEQI